MGCAESRQGGAHSPCCPPGSWPALELSYAPKGVTREVRGLKIYEIGSGSRPLIVFEDIFGIESGRHQIIADTYAALGYNVFMPEFLDPVHKGSLEDVPKILETVSKQKMPALKDKYEKVMGYLAEKGHTKVLALGFCWGVWFAFRMSADYDNILAIASPHPSLQVEGFYGGTEAKLVENVKCPAFLYVGGNDHANTKKGGEVANILARRFGENGGTEEFPEMKHGWLIRADPADAVAKRDIELTVLHSHQYLSRFAP